MPAPKFQTTGDMRALSADLPSPDADAITEATARNGQLTKPAGSLGRLEELAIWYAGWRGTARPRITQPQVVVFAGNHGVAARGVSAFPPEVTAQMVANFSTGGAAINQLAQAAGARLDVEALSLDRPTADFTEGPAMTEAELCEALEAGWQAVDPRADLLVVGEMGIGNTTSAAALAAALCGGPVAGWVGAGTGLDEGGVAAKARVVEAGLVCHGEALADPVEALRRLGGREIAAMVGALLRARTLPVPVLLDGFIAGAAAGVLYALRPDALAHVRAGHVSAEAGHADLLAALDQRPLLDLGMRLGEASGATLAIGILKGAVACLSGMATFAEAGVQDG